jgi:hypothetical protein
MHRQARAETVRGEGGRGPRGIQHPWRLAALLAAAVGITAGCSPLQILGFIFSSDLTQAPKCPLTVPGKEAKVVIIAAHADTLPSNPLLMQTDKDLAGRLTRILEERYKETKDKIKLVSPLELKNYMNKNPRWRDATPQEIGKHFGADWVINLEINSISLLDQKSMGFFYHGSADIQVTVTDAHKPVGEGQKFEDDYHLEYPKNPVERTEVSLQAFRAKFIDRMAKDLAQYFASFPPEDRYNQD